MIARLRPFLRRKSLEAVDSIDQTAVAPGSKSQLQIKKVPLYASERRLTKRGLQHDMCGT
jgi:hypothetical protein